MISNKTSDMVTQTVLPIRNCITFDVSKSWRKRQKATTDLSLDEHVQLNLYQAFGVLNSSCFFKKNKRKTSCFNIQQVFFF